MLAILAKYFLPKSSTWYIGVVAILLGLFTGTVELHHLTALVSVVNGLTDNASPAALIGFGAGLVGLRAKLEEIGKQAGG